MRETAGSPEAAAQKMKPPGDGQPTPQSVYALIQDGAGTCLVLRRSGASGWNPGKWDLPGGKVEAGERLEEAVRREIREEAELEVSLGGLLGKSEIEVRGRRIVCLVFQAKSETRDVRLSEEHDRFAWVQKAELCRLDFCPQFDCVRSLPATFEKP